MIVIKLNIVTIAPFCFPRSRLYDSVTARLHEQKFIFSFFFFFVASKNAWRGTLDSKTQTKERKWVSCELLKFVFGSAGEGNKTGTRKDIRNLWFHRNRISYAFTFLLKGFQKDGGLDSNQKESAIRRSFFRRKSADASQTKREEGPADRRLNQNLPRLRWSRRESM